MDAQTTLSKIMAYLSGDKPVEEAQVEVKFESKKMMEGEIVFEADVFEAGQACFVLNEDGERLPCPEGEYALEDGYMLKVDDQGVILSYETEAEKEESVEETTEETVATKEPIESVEASEEGAKAPRRVIETQSVSIETQFAEQISAMEESHRVALSEVESKLADSEKALAELNIVKMELEAELAEVKKQLENDPASAPIKHNVEGNVRKAQFNNVRKGKITTQDRVMNRMFNK